MQQLETVKEKSTPEEGREAIPESECIVFSGANKSCAYKFCKIKSCARRLSTSISKREGICGVCASKPTYKYGTSEKHVQALADLITGRGRLSTSHVTALYHFKENINLHERTISRYLNMAADQGLIEKHFDGCINRWEAQA